MGPIGYENISHPLVIFGMDHAENQAISQPWMSAYGPFKPNLEIRTLVVVRLIMAEIYNQPYRQKNLRKYFCSQEE